MNTPAFLMLGVKFMQDRDGVCKWSEDTSSRNLMQFD